MSLQPPRKCDICSSILVQIEPDEESRYKALHWGQQQDYWSIEFHSWEKDFTVHKKPENYSVCNKCKKILCNMLLKGK